MMQFTSMPIGLVSTQAPLISGSSHSAINCHFQKAVAVAMIVHPVQYNATNQCHVKMETPKMETPTFHENGDLGPYSPERMRPGSPYYWEKKVPRVPIFPEKCCTSMDTLCMADHNHRIMGNL